MRSLLPVAMISRNPELARTVGSGRASSAVTPTDRGKAAVMSQYTR